MNKYRVRKEAFDKQYPPPVPPLVKIVTFEAALNPDGPGYEELPDLDNEDYKRVVGIRNYLLFTIALRIFMTECVRVTTQRDTMMFSRLTKAGIEVQQAFVEYIVSISEITWQAVVKRMEELDYKWNDRPLHLISTPSTPGRMPIRDALLQIGADSYMLTERQVDEMSVKQQVDMMARAILWAKLKYLGEKARAEEAERKAKQRQRRTRR